MSDQTTHRTLIAQQGGQRLDRFLAEELGLTRSAAKRMIDRGDVTVKGDVVKAGHKLKHGEHIEVVVIEASAAAVAEPQPRAGALDILYEDEYLLALNKAVGQVVHPAPGHDDDTLVNALLAVRPEVRRADVDPQRPGIVHRLDCDTSGVLLVAKDRATQNTLLDQFRQRALIKTYLCLAYGRFKPERGAIDAPIGRNPRDRQRMAVVDDGRPARTEYLALDNAGGVSLLAVKLITGRTHQIRVHFQAIGHPVVGDATYGGGRREPRAARQMLHAWRLDLAHPATGQSLRLAAPPHDDMVRLARAVGLAWDEALVAAEGWI